MQLGRGRFARTGHTAALVVVTFDTRFVTARNLRKLAAALVLGAGLCTLAAPAAHADGVSLKAGPYPTQADCQSQLSSWPGHICTFIPDLLPGPIPEGWYVALRT